MERSRDSPATSIGALKIMLTVMPPPIRVDSRDLRPPPRTFHCMSLPGGTGPRIPVYHNSTICAHAVADEVMHTCRGARQTWENSATRQREYLGYVLAMVAEVLELLSRGRLQR